MRRGTRGAFAPALLALLGVLLGWLMLVSSDGLMSAFVAPVTEPRMPSSALRHNELRQAPLTTTPTPVFAAMALAGCLAASLRLVRRHAYTSARAHMVQLKAEPSDKESKEDKEEEEEEEEEDEDEEFEDEEFEDEEAAEEDDDGLDELVMDDDDEDDDEDFEDEDDDFEAGDDEVLYGEDQLDDGFFTTDEDGAPLEAVCRARFPERLSLEVPPRAVADPWEDLP